MYHFYHVDGTKWWDKMFPLSQAYFFSVTKTMLSTILSHIFSSKILYNVKGQTEWLFNIISYFYNFKVLSVLYPHKKARKSVIKLLSVLEKTSQFKKVVFAHGIFLGFSYQNNRKKGFWCMYMLRRSFFYMILNRYVFGFPGLG